MEEYNNNEGTKSIEMNTVATEVYTVTTTSMTQTNAKQWSKISKCIGQGRTQTT